jgi:murein DD-endopeptidase MepM/ murein hydrolase activator NlpD
VCFCFTVTGVFYIQGMKAVAALLLLFVTGCGLLQNNHSIKQIEKGKSGDDTSYIYTFPFASGKSVLLVQGYDSKFSHKGSMALDFKVKTGTPVYAARNGVVTATRKDSDRRGLKQENLADGNYIFIRHPDGSAAQYWHFKKEGVVVKEGDIVSTGQLIGYSGNTGYSAFPHLHFEVSGYDASGNYRNLPTRFRTQHGVVYLRPGKFYKGK